MHHTLYPMGIPMVPGFHPTPTTKIHPDACSKARRSSCNIFDSEKRQKLQHMSVSLHVGTPKTPQNDHF